MRTEPWIFYPLLRALRWRRGSGSLSPWPLGGVIDVAGSFGLVQVVSFEDRFPAVIRDALEGEEIRMRPGSNLRIVPIPQLVALKLYVGAWASHRDIIELLRRNPQVALEMIGETCRRYRLHGFEKIVEELRKDE